MREPTGRLSAALALAALLAACGSTPAAAPASTPAQTPVPAQSAAPASANPAAPSPSGLTHVKIGFTSKSTGGMYVYLGRDLGIFRKHGLDPEIVIGQSEALVTGLNQGDIDFLGTMPAAAQGAEKGLPIRGVFVAKDHPEYLLVGDTGISQVSQLKGKQLAGSSPEQLPALMLKRLLELDGLQATDYTVIPVANDSARAALIENHRAAASVLGLAEALPLVDGGHPIIDSTTAKVFWPSNGLAVTMDTLNKRHDMVQRAVDAAIESVSVAASDKERTMQVLEKDFGLSADQAGRLFDLMKPTYTKNGRPDQQAIQFQLATDAKAMQLPAVVPESQVYDFSLLPK